VVSPLLDPAAASELGKEEAEEAGVFHQAEAKRGPRGTKRLDELVPHPLAGERAETGSAGLIAASVAGSTANPSCAAKRTARSGRSPSSAKRSSARPTVG
jgi:hypothetical protein